MRALAVTAMLSIAVLAAGQEKISSGLPVGASTPAYQLTNVAGPYAGQTLCIR